MPFFRILKIIATLQVRIHNLLSNRLFVIQYQYKNSVKRVLPFTSPLKGSLTVEAALGLSVFLFAIITLMMPLRFINQHRIIQAGLESVAEDTSQYAYILYRLEQGDDDILSGKGAWIQEFLQKFAKSSAVIAYAALQMSDKVDKRLIDKISFKESEVLSDGEHIHLIMNYEMKLPFPMFHLKGIKQTSRSFRRAWIGREGGKSGKGEDSFDDEDQIVFVGKTRTRYHRNRYCHYLYNDLKAVSFSEIDNFRNDSGGIYKPCSACKGQSDSGTVYIMPSGGKYHQNKNCSAIIAYAEAVPLSEVEYLGSCSYCSK